MRSIAHRRVEEIDGISPLGFAIQTLRLNFLTSDSAFSALGLRLKRGEDWAQRLCLSEKLRIALIERVPTASMLARYWTPSDWQIFGGRKPYWRPQLTACEECLSTGFHSMMFQLPWVDRCPWHGSNLVSSCARCSEPLWKCFLGEMPPLVCACGYDFVDGGQLMKEPDRIAERRLRQTRRYLKWALASRGVRDVCGFMNAVTDNGSVLRIIGSRRLPWFVGERPKEGHIARSSLVRHRPIEESADAEEMAGISAGAGRGNPHFLELSPSFERTMKSVTSMVASRFSPDSFSERERALLGINESSIHDAWKPRVSLVLLVAYRVKNSLFFDGRVLSRPVQEALQQLSSMMADRSDDIEHVQNCVRVYKRVLARGYASAAFFTLAELSTTTAGKPIDWKPVATIRRRRSVSQISLLWLRPD